MLNTVDSTYSLVREQELARGSYLKQQVNQLVDEPVFYWLQGAGDSTELPIESNFGNLGTSTVSNANFANLRTAAFGMTIGLGPTMTIGQVGTIIAQSANVIVLAPREPWLVATWDLIADYRNLGPGWDGMNAVAPKRESLDTAEALAILISSKPMRARPQFSVDSSGRPSFALYDDRLYLHLTIDDADRLSWYAVFGDVESFEDDIVFDGAQLPQQLDRLL